MQFPAMAEYGILPQEEEEEEEEKMPYEFKLIPWIKSHL